MYEVTEEGVHVITDKESGKMVGIIRRDPKTGGNIISQTEAMGVAEIADLFKSKQTDGKN